EFAFEGRGTVRLKGFSRPIRLNAVVPVADGDGEVRVAGAPGDVEFRVLGPLEVLVDGRPAPLGGPRQRLVLAHLVLDSNRVVSVDQLIDRVWGEAPPRSARNTVQAYVSHLRDAVGAERIEGKAPGYVLRAEPDEVDILRFERLLRRARRSLATDL